MRNKYLLGRSLPTPVLEEEMWPRLNDKVIPITMQTLRFHVAKAGFLSLPLFWNGQHILRSDPPMRQPLYVKSRDIHIHCISMSKHLH